MNARLRRELRLWGWTLDDVSLLDWLGGVLTASFIYEGHLLLAGAVLLSVLLIHRRNYMRKIGKQMGQAHAFLRDALVGELFQKAQQGELEDR